MTTTNTNEQAVNQDTQPTTTSTHSTDGNTTSAAKSTPPMTNNIPSTGGMQVPLGMFDYAKEIETTKQQAAYQQQVGKTVFVPPVAPGSYYSVVKDAVFEANVTTKSGKCDRMTVTYLVFVPRRNQADATVDVKQYYYRSQSNKSPFVRLLSKLLGYDASQGFTIKDLIGVTCAIDVVHRVHDGNTYIDIADLQKIQLPAIPKEHTF